MAKGDDTVSRIRDAADIVEVVSARVALRRAGRNFVGLCPFHAEKTPSFSVNPARRSFHCFGCGEGGDVFDFLMKTENLSFPEALAILGERCGIKVERYSPAAGRSARSEREAVLAANREAAAFFAARLAGPEGAAARAYLARRKIGGRAVEAFGLGYAPPGWHNVDMHLRARGVSAEIMEKAGLTSKNESGKTYDRFRDRLMFPIRDQRGEVLGFGGRTLTDDTPKYLNSPQSPVYDKKRVLYGIREAATAIRSEGAVFVVEGYVDVISLWEAGVENVAATCGTALSPEHARLLKNLAGRVVLVFDADKAGVAAAVRSLPIFTAERAEARVLSLSAGHDPDTFVHAHGPEAFRGLAEKSVDLVRFIMDESIARNGLSVTGRTRVVEELKAPLAAISDPVARSLYVRGLAQAIGVDEIAVLSHVREAAGPPNPREAAAPAAPPAGGSGNPLERRIIETMLVSTEFLEEIRCSAFLEDFESETLKTIGLELLKLGPEAARADLMSLFERAEDRCLVAGLFAQSVPADPAGCRQLLTQFETVRLRRRQRELTLALAKASEAGDEEALACLLSEKSRLAAGIRYRE